MSRRREGIGRPGKALWMEWPSANRTICSIVERNQVWLSNHGTRRGPYGLKLSADTTRLVPCGDRGERVALFAFLGVDAFSGRGAGDEGIDFAPIRGANIG
jgi:hypothetical protein